jgi:hypothetical protein
MSNPVTYTIKKASGEMVPFSSEKLRMSLARAGVSQEVIDRVLDRILHFLHDGITTKKIYRLAFSLLKKERKPLAARYKLKQGIMELGPSGFPFEKFVAEVLKTMAYRTEVGILMEGHCVSHEVDIVARRGREIAIIECKYHNRQGFNCNVKTPLYVHSRFRDIEQKMNESGEGKHHTLGGWLITNTRFTPDAIRYGLCSGLKLLSWDYPGGAHLKGLIERSGLYPLTCLTTLTLVEKQRLLDRGIVLCKEICMNQTLLSELHIREPRLKAVITETNELCKGYER